MNRLRILAASLAVVCTVTGADAEELISAGNEFQINSYTTGIQAGGLHHTVAQLDGGGFVVAWSSSPAPPGGSPMDVLAQRYDSNGSRAGTEFRVNGYTTGGQGDPSVAPAPGGGFAVVWNDNGEIAGRVFDAAGSPIAADFAVNTHTTGTQQLPALASGPTGSFVAVWDSSPGVDGREVAGRRFGSTGTLLGSEFQANTYTTGDQRVPDVAAAADGTFVVVWTSSSQGGGGPDIFGQRFDSTGARAGAEFAVNSYTTYSQQLPAVAVDASGRFVVVWMGDRDDPGAVGTGIFGHRFDSDGSGLGADFLVNSYTTDGQAYAKIAADDDGGFVVVWQSGDPGDYGTQDGSGTGFFLRRFDSAGTAVTGDIQVNAETLGDQGSAWTGVASDGSGGFVVTWDSKWQDGDNRGVFGRRFYVCGNSLVSGGEGCDDGNTVDADGCSASCQEELGYTCSGEPSTCVFPCGDGVIDAGDECDDGDLDDGDGCSAGCEIEPGYTCTGEPSTCVFTCGDGVIDAGDECDDGDLDDGDGCSAGCEIEPAFTCTGAPSQCTTCPAAALPGCRIATPAKSRVQLRDDGDDQRDRLKWKWNKGLATPADDFRDPVGTPSDYRLCAYDVSGAAQPLLDLRVGAGGTCDGKPCWKSIGPAAAPKGFKYKNKAGNSDGLRSIKLKAGVAGKPHIQVRGQGSGLAMPMLGLTLPAIVQLVIADADGTTCFETTFTSAAKNTVDYFKAKGP